MVDNYIRILGQIIQSNGCIVENKLPGWLKHSDFDGLIAEGYVVVGTVCPPRKESEHPRGLVGYYITQSGRDFFFKNS